jgi:CTP:molybdopterin cytidylyltransferase MocA
VLIEPLPEDPMTVAAVILSATAEGSLADTLGQPRVRRLADLAWAGGALPIIVVSPDPAGAVAAALTGSEAVHGPPAREESGPVGQMIRGCELAEAEVHETTGFLVWPARMTWVGPETITTLIETHGMSPDHVLQPAWHGEPGWPVLVPAKALTALRSIDPARMPADIVADLVESVPSVVVEVGDPGVVHDVDTSFDDLPPYEGPPEPPGDHRHEWGADVAAEAGLTGR